MNFIEGPDIELKEVFVNDIKKEVVAFANTQGGTIYIGVSNEGEIIGLDTPDKVMLQAVNSIRDSIKPDITMFTDCSIEKIQNKNIVKISVQRGTARPYYLPEKGLKPSGVYVRQGSASVPASDDAIRQMIKETDGNTYEKTRSMSQELTFIYCLEEMKKRDLEFGSSQQKTLGLIGNDELYTNLGLLLSDQCIHSIKAAYFEGIEKRIFKDRREFNGSLLKQLNECYHYLDLFNKTRATFSELYRIDERDYPPEAVREALLNSIIHREYSFSGSILINIFEDRMEFISLGGLVPGLSLEAIMVGVSQSRNERLANVFYRLRLIEAYGTGIVKIMSSYKNSSKKPIIKALEGAFQVVLPNLNYIIPSTKEEADYLQNELKTQHKKVIDLINKNGCVTRKDVENHLKIGQTRALSILKEMVDMNLLVSTGNGRITEYRKK